MKSLGTALFTCRKCGRECNVMRADVPDDLICWVCKAPKSRAAK